MKRREFLRPMTALAAGSVLPAAPAIWSPARAQSRQETVLAVTEYGPNNFDIHGVGTNRPGYEVAWNCYDRLMTHGKKTLPDGVESYDRDTFLPELAEDWNLTATSSTFKLRKDATFHDGTPVTANDVKWSFDRAVTVGGFPTFQMKAGSLEKPEQFVAVDAHTFRVDFIRKDRLTMPDLAVIVPAVYHSELVKNNATEKDPWGLEYTKGNIAGGGAYKVTRWQPGTEVVFERNDNWKSGPLPKVKRVVWRTVPSAGNRRALLERGDADISVDLPNKDFVELKQLGKLLQESLAQIGIRTTINKVPGANWRNELLKKEMPLIANFFSGWLDYPEYFFFWCYHGQNAVFNTMSYQDKDTDALIDAARTAAANKDQATYDRSVNGFVEKAFAEVPRVPLFQPMLSTAMQKNLSGYRYWFHRQLDYRSLAKA